MKTNLKIKTIKTSKYREFIDLISNNTNNKRFNKQELLDVIGQIINSGKDMKILTLYDGDDFLAMCVIMKNYITAEYGTKSENDIYYMRQFTGIKKGYGRKMLNMILKKYDDIWWCSERVESLYEYYRSFDGVKEKPVFIKGLGYYLHYFYKSIHDDAERSILTAANELRNH